VNGELGRSQVSGTFRITATVPGSIVVRIPATAEAPAKLTIRNNHASAVIYGKWAPTAQTNPSVSANDAGIVLAAGDSYTDDAPPKDAVLILISTVADAQVNVDARWRMPEEAEI